MIQTIIAGQDSDKKKRAYRVLKGLPEDLHVAEMDRATDLLSPDAPLPDFLICTEYDSELEDIIPELRKQNRTHALTIVLFDETACAPTGTTTISKADASTRLKTISKLFDYWIVTPIASEQDLANQFRLAVFLCEKKRQQFQEKVQRKEVESQIHNVLNSIVDAIITIDRRGRIRSFNTTAEELFEYATAEVTGKNVSVLMPEPYVSEHDDYMNHYHQTGERRIIGIGREVKGRKKSGEVFPMYLAVSESEMGGEVIYTGIVRDLSEQRRLEREVLRISEYERGRIGQDLHDGLGQMLTGIGLISKNLERELLQEVRGHDEVQGDEVSSGDDKVFSWDDLVRLRARLTHFHTSAAEITDLIKEADEFARNLARGLVPVDFDQKGLENALVRLAENAEKLFNIRCEIRVTGQSEFEDNSQAIHFYRIAQESVSNAVKHGAAGSVQILLAGGPDRIRLRISDDGSGFRDDWHQKQGLGVRIMQFRARLSGAELEISSKPGEGTTITCTLNKS